MPKKVIPPKSPETQFQTGGKAAEIGRKGGIASGISKRAKKSMKALAAQIAAAPVVSDKARQKLRSVGISDDDLTNNAAICAALFGKALQGEIKAVEKWQELTEAETEDEKRFDIPARLIGSSFVDINREIVPNVDYIFKGGRGSLKSSFISLKLIEILKNNGNLHACVVRQVASTIKDSVYSQIKWAINILGLDEEFEFRKNPLEIRYKKTGQTIYFRGCDDPVKLKSIKPEFGYIGILWVEERDQIAGIEAERSIKQSVLRGGSDSFFFGSYNPPKTAASWVNKADRLPGKGTVIHTSDYRSAPKDWLGQKFIDDAEHLKDVNPQAYEHEYLGNVNGDGGNVFESLEIRPITDEEIARFSVIYQGVDWGWYPDPYCFVRLAYEAAQETIYIFEEHYCNKQSNAQTAEWIKERGYDDYKITCDSAEPKSVNDYKDLGLPAYPAQKGAGSIDYSFKWLQCRKIVIDADYCPLCAEEFANYEYMRDKEGNVISGYPDKDNHAIDAVRYALEDLWRRRGNQA